MNFSSFFNYPGQTDAHRLEDSLFLPNQSEEDWVKLLSYMSTRRLQAGETVFQRGDAGRGLYLVTDGSLEVLIPQGPTLRRIATIEKGSVFGEQAFLDGKPRSATTRAITDAELRLLDTDGFAVLSAREPDLAFAILFDLGRILSIRLRETTAFLSRRP